MKGKLIVIEGTDCSGKETQSSNLLRFLNDNGYNTVKLNFPDYESPTGKIVGSSYLGKNNLGKGYFPEGAGDVDPYVASLYYAADRRYNSFRITDALDAGINVILDRYVTSNMGHQGGKIEDKEKRIKMYHWLEKLEYEMLELPRPDITFFLHMPYKFSCKLKENRESIDEHERSKEHLVAAEKTYLEMAELFNFNTIKCYTNESIKSIEEISSEINTDILKYLKENN